jgi:hypothetical protein
MVGTLYSRPSLIFIFDNSDVSHDLAQGLHKS